MFVCYIHPVYVERWGYVPILILGDRLSNLFSSTNLRGVHFVIDDYVQMLTM